VVFPDHLLRTGADAPGAASRVDTMPGPGPTVTRLAFPK
jgi:hypothetical protein